MMAYAERRKDDWRVCYKRPDGTWAWEPGFATRQEALDWGRDQEADIRAGRFYDDRDGAISFEAWAAKWLEAADVIPNTAYSYHKRIRGQLNPRWGTMTMAEIHESPLEVRKWVKDVYAAHSRNYADGIVGVFRMLMDDAVVEKLIPTSPLQARRKRGRYVRPEKDEPVFPTAVQALLLADNARVVWDLAGYVFMLTKAYTGLRQGEMYGLRREYCHPLWPGADPDRTQRRKAAARYRDLPAIRVEWQYLYERPTPEEAAVPVLRPPKYGSKRTVVIPVFLADLLALLLDSHDSEWVFPSLSGVNLLLTEFSTTYWRPVVEGSDARTSKLYARPEIMPVEGMEALVPHGLRHAQKVWLDEDQHAEVAKHERMGHLLQGVDGVYSHATVTMERRIASMLQKRWERSEKEKQRALAKGARE
ncbi:hypothetical protein ABIA32_002756 [Streptacidiphilus sp. MAP12-20]|uniref:hypothetical protein n=1 Tax=Streptacidiphilus sp. MAP12-20 TaxID=3156299 RepID=UPI0035116DDB